MSNRRKKKKRKSILPGLGYSPAQRTAPGAGTHGGSKRERARRRRREERRQLREES